VQSEGPNWPQLQIVGVPCHAYCYLNVFAMMINSFDHAVISAINQFAQHSRAFDRIINYLQGAHLLKGAVLSSAIWWAWFRTGLDQAMARRHVVTTIAACIVAIALARAFQLVLPFRARPMHVAELGFVLPYGMLPSLLKDWSSFPSDHAVLFFTLSTGLWFVSRRAGTLALLFSTVVVCLPRLYLGLHYPTDLIAGAALGAGVAALGNWRWASTRPVEKVVEWSQNQPQLFYPLFFLLTFQIAVMFDDVRSLASAAAKLFFGEGV
jgi:undecaprenyl-diphosphatase